VSAAEVPEPAADTAAATAIGIILARFANES
jgi:hypothetical protein